MEKREERRREGETLVATESRQRWNFQRNLGKGENLCTVGYLNL